MIGHRALHLDCRQAGWRTIGASTTLDAEARAIVPAIIHA